ncbi:uncharacterized protein LOC144355229 [Saccoglossus kowalevskii]
MAFHAMMLTNVPKVVAGVSTFVRIQSGRILVLVMQVLYWKQTGNYAQHSRSVLLPFLSTNNSNQLTNSADKNECVDNNGGCDHNCGNTDGSFVCSCDVGYALGSDGLSCSDVNECENNNGNCEYECENTSGSFLCTCNDGYILNIDTLTCSDINECEDSNGKCDQICHNLEGSYACSCNDGYTLNKDGESCDENFIGCDNHNGDCEHICDDSNGSVTCSCNLGFELKADAKSCRDMGCQMQDGLSYPTSSRNIIKHGKTNPKESPEKCCENCRQTQQCTNWTWDKTNKACTLKNGSIRPRTARNHVSGQI